MTYLGQANFIKKFSWPKLLQAKSSDFLAQALGTAYAGFITSWQMAMAGTWNVCEQDSTAKQEARVKLQS